MTDSQDPADSSVEESAEVSRKDFLKIAMSLSAILAFGGVGTVLKAISNPAPPGGGTGTFPRYQIPNANVSNLSVLSPMYFDYPLQGEPNFLVKLGQKAAGGVGPDQDIVAFSQVCQHLGCTSISCKAQGLSGGPVANCSCHGSVFDLLQSAKVIAGPSPRPQPQVQLEVDSSGNILAKGMGPPTIYGHNTGSNDVSADLTGGTPVA
ncbi:MAG TPA: Rieske 2Fe-2S domain-containing protein [Candidatus Bathyarchaeia archaeon]|nr:Rieske 2Fe-2S domain-containing protein [Candidatus Bathyarchaeia archaeon]